MTRFRWGIFGTGAISAKMAVALNRISGAKIAMVASRDGTRAQAFAAAFGIPRAIGSYAEAAAAGGVDAIYIATPPALHLPHALLAIEQGIGVLVEKPFATGPAEAQALANAAAAHGVFCMEAMWTRFVPAARAFRDAVADGAIGVPHVATGRFATNYHPDAAHGNFDPARGGGALAHLGIYPVSLGQWLFGTPEQVRAVGTIGATGVDEDVALALRYPYGVLAGFDASLRSGGDSGFAVAGDAGSVRLRGPVFRPWGIETRREAPRGAPSAELSRGGMIREGALAQRVNQWRQRLGAGGGRVRSAFFDGNGYGHQAHEVMDRIRAGSTESPVMPLADTIAVLTTLAAARAQLENGTA